MINKYCNKCVAYCWLWVPATLQRISGFGWMDGWMDGWIGRWMDRW